MKIFKQINKISEKKVKKKQQNNEGHIHTHTRFRTKNKIQLLEMKEYFVFIIFEIKNKFKSVLFFIELPLVLYF